MHDNIIFDLQSQEHCYLLGFLWADAYVGSCPSHKHYSFSFEIVEDDFLIIWPLLEKVGFSKFSTRFRKNSKRAQCCIRTATQDNLAFFIDWGFHKKDEGCPLYFHLSPAMRPFFIKGFLDGDGSISLDKNQLFRVGFNGNKDQSWDFLEDFLNDAGIEYAIYRKERKASHQSHTRTHGYSVLEFTKLQDRVDLCNILSRHNIGLKRKMGVYESFRQERIEKQKTSIYCKQIKF
jgi:hypothetical protein